MASSVAGIVCLISVFITAVPSLGKDYTVGDSSGWALSVDYSTWATGKTFNVGDNLVFKYGSGHTVDEVSSGDYSSCTIGNSITTDSSGSTKIPLKTAGTHYFICGVIGHCSGGMKVAVTVAAGATPAPAGTSAPPATAGGTSATFPTPTATMSGSNPGLASSSGSFGAVVDMLLSTCVILVYKLVV